LLLEVRLLRQDIAGFTGFRPECFATADARKHTASRISEVEGILGTLNAAAPEVKDMKGEIASLQRRASDQDSEVQACQSEEAASVNQYQKEKAQLTELRDRVDFLDKSLQRFTPTVK
jgi:chromosome segregation ATPase